MYQSLLTRRYLTTKVMPLLSVVAVALATGMVLIVWSVMGGFLAMLLDSGRTLIGDVVLMWPVSGFGYYDELVVDLEADPMIEGAAPMIETLGVLNLPDGRVVSVQVKGIDGPSYDRVTDYFDAIWWKPITKPLPKDKKRGDPRLANGDSALSPAFLSQLEEDGRLLSEPDSETGTRQPALVLGTEVAGYNERTEAGFYRPSGSVGRRTQAGGIEWTTGFAPILDVTLNVLPLDRNGRAIDVVSLTMPVANEFRAGLHEIDRSTVFVQLGALQRMLKMDAAERIDLDSFNPLEIPDGGFGASPVLGVEPARVTHVLVRGKAGADPDVLAQRCFELYSVFAQRHPGEVPEPGLRMNAGGSIMVLTWEQLQGTFIAAVKKETGMVLFLLVLLSFAASFLIFAIFWSMVSEKTKDIGVLRAIGASARGVAWIWLRYGIVIGVLGAIGGGLLSGLVVWNINEIHDWLGRALGLTIWDPKVYYFLEIPNHINTVHAAMVLSGGVIMSVIGALVPSLRAARMDPVQALRFE